MPNSGINSNQNNNVIIKTAHGPERTSFFTSNYLNTSWNGSLITNFNKYKLMYYRAGTGEDCCLAIGQTLHIIHQMAALFCMK